MNILNIPEEIFLEILKFIKKKNIYNIILTNTFFINIGSDNKIWKSIAINEKNNFFWKLAGMRTKSIVYPICNYELSMKEQLYNMYLYEKENVRKVHDVHYFEIWLLSEIITFNNIIIASNMLNEIIKTKQNETK